MLHRYLVFANGILGAVLALSGAITAYANTLGPSGRGISAALAGLGVAQLVAAALIHAIYGTDTPAVFPVASPLIANTVTTDAPPAPTASP